MLTFCLWGPWNTFLWNLKQEAVIPCKKIIWKCRLQIGSHLFLAIVCKHFVLLGTLMFTLNFARIFQVLTHWSRDKMQTTFWNAFFCITILNYDWNSTDVCSNVSVEKPALIQVIAWCHTGDKPLPEAMLTKVVDAIRPQRVNSSPLVHMRR